MGVCLVIATRGRREQLIGNIAQTMVNAVRSDTEILVVQDEDDKQLIDPAFLDADYWFMSRVRIIKIPRTDTLGEKYNRGYEQAQYSDLYVPFVDTVHITTPGWDERLYRAAKRFKDGIGSVYFGEQHSPLSLPQMIGVTRKFVEVQGFFMPPYFPYWWHDTWTDEVSQLTRRIVHADVKLSDTPAGKQTRGAQEITFWANAYYDLRNERLQIARDLIDASDYEGWQKEELKLALPFWLVQLNEREAGTTRNKKWAAEYERLHTFDTKRDERYFRTRAAMLQKLVQVGALTQEQVAQLSPAVEKSGLPEKKQADLSIT